jgi:HisJ family histidinol phosphate phosphatase
MEDEQERAARQAAIPDSHGHAKGEHKAFAEERPIPYTARMLFLWFYHACRRGSPRFMMVADHVNYLTFEDPAAVNLVRRALKLAGAGDLLGAAETAGVEVQHAAVVSEGLRRGMRYSIGAEVDNDPRNRPDAQNIVDAMRPDAIVRSIHFLSIDHADLGAGYQWAFDNPEFQYLYEQIGTEKVWELYMAALLEAIDKLPTNIVGHFYVPAKFGHWPDDATLERYEDQLIDLCAERGYAIEVNSRIFYRTYVPEEQAQEQRQRYFDVHLRLLQKAKAKGVMISVGSDAHSPRDQGGGFDAVLEMLDGADINEVAFPTNGRIARVALRVTEELLRPSLPEPPPLAPPPAEDEDEDEDGEVRPEPPAIEQPPAAAASAEKPARKRSRPARAEVPAQASVEIEAVSIVETVEAEGEVVEAVVSVEEIEIVAATPPRDEPAPQVKRSRRSPKHTVADAPGAAFAGEPPPPVETAAETAAEAPPKRGRAAQPAAGKPPVVDKPPVRKAGAGKPARKPEPKSKSKPAAAVKAKAAPKAAPKASPAKAAAPKAAAAKTAAKPAKKAAPKPAARNGVKKTAAKPPARAAKKNPPRAAARKPAAKAPARKAAAKKAATKRPAAKIAKRSAPAKRIAKKTPAKATAKKKSSKSRR